MAWIGAALLEMHALVNRSRAWARTTQVGMLRRPCVPWQAALAGLGRHGVVQQVVPPNGLCTPQ
eukprot:328660-Pyramimonas_sp.AAC.1